MKKHIEVSPDVARIRSRYFAARERGAGHDEAVAHANDYAPTRKPGSLKAPTDEQRQAIADDTVVDIPEIWAALHYQKRLQIAKTLVPDFVPAADDKSGSINRLIEAEIARRAGEAS
jgi:hypothetical protein